jgi:hypothetical protein
MISIRVDATSCHVRIRRLLSTDPLAGVAALLAKDALKYLQSITPQDTGAIKRGWYSKIVVQSDGTYAIEIHNKHVTPELMNTLEHGSPAHVIYPKRKKALMFQVNGRKVFAAYVFAKGTPPLKLIHKTELFANRRLPLILEKVYNT